MIRLFKHYIPKSIFILGVLEILLLLCSFWGGMRLRFALAGLESPLLTEHMLEMFCFVSIVYIVLLATGLYRLETCRMMRLSFVRISVSIFISLMALSMVLFIFPDIDIWRSVVFYALLLMYLGLLVDRYIFLHVVDLNRLKRRVLVLGAGVRAEGVRASGKGKESYVKFVGFLCMDDNESSVEESVDYMSIGSLLEYARRVKAQEIIVAIQERRGKLPLDALLKCKMNGIAISDAASFIEQQSGAVSLNNVDPSWMIFSDGFGGVRKLDLFVKRLFDVFTSLLLLLISFPFLLLTALLVKVTSPGPVFYRQKRVGLGGKVFDVLKFRSMTENAEADGVPRWAGEGDMRVTPIGDVIRKLRVDEIPQIFNVLSGDMSFVGPRPERPYFVEQLGDEIPFYNERHIVKPGITGWAQLNYPYGASTEDSRCKLEFDLYYVKNYSIFLDFLILIQTVRVVLWPEGVR